jgi:hypothetical protein
MARHEADREDLWREIRGLSPRIEIIGPGFADSVVAGFRPALGGWSVYFGQDPVWHFDSAGRLRRAYLDGSLYRSQGDTLSRLTRRRTGTTVELVRHDLDAQELQAIVERMRRQIREVQTGLESETLTVLRQHPAEQDGLDGFRTALIAVLHTPQPLSPAISSR